MGDRIGIVHLNSQIGIVRLDARRRPTRLYVEWRKIPTFYQDLEGDVEDLIDRSMAVQDNDMVETSARMEDELKLKRVKLELKNDIKKGKKKMESDITEIVRRKRQQQQIEAEDMDWIVTVRANA